MINRRMRSLEVNAPRVGTAGWNVTKACNDWIGGGGSHLERYSQALNAVEINTSFYRPHRRSTYEKWAHATLDDFRFAVKVPQHISHEAPLRQTDLDQFIQESAGLGAKLSVFLVQFPPGKKFDQQEAQTLFGAFRKRTAVALACEPRHASWFAPNVDAWFQQYRISRVAADPSRTPGADQPGGWLGLRYFRLHGSPHIYYSAYDKSYLNALAAQLAGPFSSETWCIFDNTAARAALRNALELSELEKTRKTS